MDQQREAMPAERKAKMTADIAALTTSKQRLNGQMLKTVLLTSYRPNDFELDPKTP